MNATIMWYIDVEQNANKFVMYKNIDLDRSAYATSIWILIEIKEILVWSGWIIVS